MYNLSVEASYPTPYATSALLPMLLLSMAGQKHTPDTKSEFKDIYDYIVIGGGSAGSVVASRLSEKECVTVLLLEAGKSPPKVTDIPTVARSFIETDIDWNYVTAPQENTGSGLVNRSIAWPSGKTVGGSSVINAMINVRGNHKNFDDWAKQGARGWSYGEVLPYFKKMEDNVNIFNEYHGAGGPVTASRPQYKTELQSAVFEAARKMGYRVGDANGERQEGIYDLQATMRSGQRCSAAKAYLVPSENRTNLDIVTEAFVKKILIENMMATGVVVNYKGRDRVVRVYKEIIVSAGAIKSAQLLMLSGIGPSEELEKHRIPVLANLPVGKNLQDHCGTLVPFELYDNVSRIADKQVDENNIRTYISNKTGVLTSVQGVATIAFVDRNRTINGTNDKTDVQLYFWEAVGAAAKTQLRYKPEIYDQLYKPYENRSFYWCLSQILNPKSSGRVLLRSANPYDAPIIDPMYFSHPDDLEVVVEGMKQCKMFATSPALVKIGSKPFTTKHPGCEQFFHDDDRYYRCIARSVVLTLSHPAGTAKMGNPRDPSTVVDPELRVKMVRRLRVIDASVMPNVTSGNTNVPTMMIAEKGVDMIKRTIRCPKDNELYFKSEFFAHL